MVVAAATVLAVAAVTAVVAAAGLVVAAAVAADLPGANRAGRKLDAFRYYLTPNCKKAHPKGRIQWYIYSYG